VAGGRFGSRLVAELVVDKYRDGIPLHREKQRFERLGCSLSVSTLSDQISWVMELLLPLWRAALAMVLRAKVMHLDATSLLVLDHDAAGGKRLGSLWGYAGSDAGGQRAAVAYTILACCQLAEVNPVEYLADVLPRLMQPIRLRDVPDLLPARWKTLRQATSQA
jgi:hypothetical protein